MALKGERLSCVFSPDGTNFCVRCSPLVDEEEDDEHGDNDNDPGDDVA